MTSLSDIMEIDKQMKEAAANLNKIAAEAAKLGVVVNFEINNLRYLHVSEGAPQVVVKLSVDPTILKD